LGHSPAHPRTEETLNRSGDLPGNSAPNSKKNELRPWKVQRFCIPQRDLARFVAQMEVVLDLYTSAANQQEPLVYG
jgi:hypothetical protein